MVSHLPPFRARPAWSTCSAKASTNQNGLSLRWVSEEMKGDRELCMAAVAQDGLALEFVSEEMKGDRDVCKAADAQLTTPRPRSYLPPAW